MFQKEQIDNWLYYNKLCEEIIKETIKYAQILPSLNAQFSIFTPYPGTPIFEQYKDLITEKKLENFNQFISIIY